MDTYVQGTCHLMCPEKERIMRENQNMLHILELDIDSVSQKGPRRNNRPRSRGDPKRVVKEFRRCAAGRGMQQPNEIRPFSVLTKTVDYLLGITSFGKTVSPKLVVLEIKEKQFCSAPVVEDTRVPWNVVYEFVTDRLQSVRQDMVIQDLPYKECITILEPIIRFHAYAAFRLCEEPVYIFDPVLNMSPLRECLKRLLVMYDADKTESDSRNEMEALYTVIFLGDTTALTRALSVNTERKCQIMDIALRLSLSKYGMNYVRVCRLLKNLPPLLAAAASLHLPLIRRKALEAMNFAYSSKNLRYPISHLKSLLLFNSETDAVAECKHYDLHVSDNMVHFHKGTFNPNTEIFPTTKLKFINAELDNIALPRLLLGDKDSVES